jgi:hypothetical protein
VVKLSAGICAAWSSAGSPGISKSRSGASQVPCHIFHELRFTCTSWRLTSFNPLVGRAGVDENLDVDDPGLDRMLELLEFVRWTALDEVGVQGPGRLETLTAKNLFTSRAQCEFARRRPR